jgi:hypothetical protein
MSLRTTLSLSTVSFGTMTPENTKLRSTRSQVPRGTSWAIGPRGSPRSYKLAAVFNIDETALANWDAMFDKGFCSYKTQAKLSSNASDAAIIPVLELFDFAKTRGIAQLFVTGGPTGKPARPDNQESDGRWLLNLERSDHAG